MQAREKDYKIKAMLQVAIHRKKGMFLSEISEAIGKTVSAIYGVMESLSNLCDGSGIHMLDGQEAYMCARGQSRFPLGKTHVIHLIICTVYLFSPRIDHGLDLGG